MFFDGFRPGCRDRVFRALAIARAANLLELTRLCAAWLAHIDFNAERYSDVQRSLIYVAESYAGYVDAALVRSHLVLADFSMLAGQVRAARRHYERARRGAVEMGDEATIAAIIFNRAAMSLYLVRLTEAIGLKSDLLLSTLDLEVQSATLFHRAANHNSLKQLLDLLNARLSFLRDDFHKAAETYSKLLRAKVPISLASDERISTLEYSLCLLKLERVTEARTSFDAAIAVESKEGTIEDELVISWLVCRLLDGFGENGLLTSARLELESLRLAYRERVRELSGQLREIEACFQYE
jgi:tetratricopeptide (TPR) repeat protein